MTNRPDQTGTGWSGGRPQLNLAKGLGAFTRFSQVKAALLQGGVAHGQTATLVGLGGFQICSFERSNDLLGDPEVRLNSQHIHANHIVDGVSFEIGAGLDIEYIDIGAGGSVAVDEGVGLRQLGGGGHVLLRFAGFFRGHSFYISSGVVLGMDAPGTGAYVGAGYQYSEGTLSNSGGIGKLPAGWYRTALLGDPESTLSVVTLSAVQRSVADPNGVSDTEDWQVYEAIFQTTGNFGTLVGGGFREDHSDLTTDTFSNNGSDFDLEHEDRQLLLSAYPAGGSQSVVWTHIHVTDSDAEDL